MNINFWKLDCMHGVQKSRLVLVHGYLGGSDQWNQQISDFSTNFDVVTPNLPGFGSNSFMKSPCCINAYADYIISILDEADITDFHLLGHSMGGMIAQVIAVKIPQRVNKLILYGTGALGIMPGRFETVDYSRQQLTLHGLEVSARRISEKWFVLGKLSKQYEGCAQIALQASLQAAFAGLTAMQTWSGIDDLSKIKSNTLILWGDSDRSYSRFTTIQLHEGIVNSTLIIVKNGSHVIHTENPYTFNQIVKNFLD